MSESKADPYTYEEIEAHRNGSYAIPPRSSRWLDTVDALRASVGAMREACASICEAGTWDGASYARQIRALEIPKPAQSANDGLCDPCRDSIDAHVRVALLYRLVRERAEAAERTVAQLRALEIPAESAPSEDRVPFSLPCGCVGCVCDNDKGCSRCGAKVCKTGPHWPAQEGGA